MPRTCTICTHPDRHELEKAIVDGLSNRGIAKQFSVGADAVLRHRRDHFPQAVAETVVARNRSRTGGNQANRGTAAVAGYARQRADVEEAHVVDVFHELYIQLERLGKLYDSIHEWMNDPDDPSKYFLGARSHEIMVVYEDYRDRTPNGMPKRKRATLEWLLDQIERNGHHGPERAETSFADPRDLLVKVSAELRQQMQLRVSILEKLYNAQEVEAFQDAVLNAIAEVSPDVRRSIEDALRRRQPLRRTVGAIIR